MKYNFIMSPSETREHYLDAIRQTKLLHKFKCVSDEAYNRDISVLHRAMRYRWIALTGEIVEPRGTRGTRGTRITGENHDLR